MKINYRKQIARQHSCYKIWSDNLSLRAEGLVDTARTFTYQVQDLVAMCA